jgi:hypothetical protein
MVWMSERPVSRRHRAAHKVSHGDSLFDELTTAANWESLGFLSGANHPPNQTVTAPHPEFP